MSPTVSLPSEPQIVLDREKLLAVVHHVIELCSDDPDRLGRTKLHKVLYFSDMLHFVQTGAPLTGVEYLKQPFGPTARHLGWALRELSRTGAVDLSVRTFHGLEKHDFRSRRPLQSNRLSETEKCLIGDIVEFVCGFSAKEISEISHDKPWAAVELGKRIPYATAFLLLPQRLPMATDLEWAESQAKLVEERRPDEAVAN